LEVSENNFQKFRKFAKGCFGFWIFFGNIRKYFSKVPKRCVDFEFSDLEFSDMSENLSEYPKISIIVHNGQNLGCGYK
jgi:hypothetical protein